MTQRGRPRKHRWFSFKNLENEFSPEAQYLKWASANNTALQAVAATGCTKCRSMNIEFRYDKKYKIIRFHCFECGYETSYRIKVPKPGSFEIVPILTHGILVGEKVVDFYHPVTRRQRSDALVLKYSRSVENGKISLGGEWYVDGKVGGVYSQKRCYVSFDEAIILCSWNRMQTEHEKRLSELEKECIV
jgi:hypothetical protein